ncbi:hypothetical protein [Streptomyces sp. NBC_00342]|uniref:hypothetical protein n=1 Tax=Streptomyces sp. NBC_00342 TaxID=2975718 RepID=UPI002E2B61AD|nr:hypothetical protein [Streptomyces sp. NBC_00342]
MKPQTHLAIDGYVDQVPAPGTGWGTARFDLVHSPIDADRIAPDTPDTVYACTTEDPNLAAALLNEIQPGDFLYAAAQRAGARPTPGSSWTSAPTSSSWAPTQPPTDPPPERRT